MARRGGGNKGSHGLQGGRWMMEKGEGGWVGWGGVGKGQSARAEWGRWKSYNAIKLREVEEGQCC